MNKVKYALNNSLQSDLRIISLIYEKKIFHDIVEKAIKFFKQINIIKAEIVYLCYFVL